MTNAGESCLSCRYWHADAASLAREAQRAQGGGLGVRRSEFFLCRRYPPMPAPGRAIVPGEPRAFYPQTTAADWCGEWAERHAAPG